MSSARERSKKPKKTIQGYSPKDIEIRVVKNFLDILVLIEMKKNGSVSGYDITEFINSKINVTLSPGTVYATLYSMERKGLIKGESEERKTIYKLTPGGERVVSTMMQDFNLQMAEFVKKFLIL